MNEPGCAVHSGTLESATFRASGYEEPGWARVDREALRSRTPQRGADLDDSVLGSFRQCFIHRHRLERLFWILFYPSTPPRNGLDVDRVSATPDTTARGTARRGSLTLACFRQMASRIQKAKPLRDTPSWETAPVPLRYAPSHI
jgi:hypothetical protein